jgi:hypothetical protein
MEHLEEIHKSGTAGCSWGPAIDGYIRGDGSLDSKVYHTLYEAKLACGALEDCGGITMTSVGTTAEAKYELRDGTVTAKSPSGETSWLILNGADCRKGAQCSVEGSWQNFNERRNGRYHRILALTHRATAFLICVSIACFSLVLYRFCFFVESGKLLSRIIAVKSFVQDLPLQLCIVLYLYGWYAPSGLRCQLCFFDPTFCDNEHPLHFSNSWCAC